MSLRVAVIGSGPAGLYSIQHLLEQTLFDVRIDLIERLPTPWGLIRAGVAPDHPEKKQITDRLFQFYLKHPRVRFFGNVEVGTDISHAELTSLYDAVIYAVGADDDRSLGIAGEELPGSWSAREFVAWYNGHPDYHHLQFDLSDPCAVIVGTGNVALDVARILTLPIKELACTDIADHALAALRESKVKEVIILGRRGCQDAAFHNPELEELGLLEGVDIRIEADDLVAPEHANCDWETGRKLATLMKLQSRRLATPVKRITFKFHHSPIALLGIDSVDGIKIQATGDSHPFDIPCGLVLRAIGYRGRPFPGLPFDTRANVISNVAGRVMGPSHPLAGSYVTGWIKRGPRGVIGSNKKCAAATVECLIEDALSGRLNAGSGADIAQKLPGRGPIVDYRSWQKIDRSERQAGVRQDRPRVKKTAIADLLAAASATG